MVGHRVPGGIGAILTNLTNLKCKILPRWTQDGRWCRSIAHCVQFFGVKIESWQNDLVPPSVLRNVKSHSVEHRVQRYDAAKNDLVLCCKDEIKKIRSWREGRWCLPRCWERLGQRHLEQFGRYAGHGGYGGYIMPPMLRHYHPPHRNIIMTSIWEISSAQSKQGRINFWPLSLTGIFPGYQMDYLGFNSCQLCQTGWY